MTPPAPASPPASSRVRQPLVDGRVEHSASYRARRFWNWFPLGVAYALLYMGRYNLTVAQGELGSLMTKEAFGDIFAAGTLVYGCAFLLNGPLTDRLGGRAAMLLAVFGAGAANAVMGLYLRSTILGGSANASSVKAVLMALYVANMYFQSFGAVAIVKVNSSWFHVRERGSFSGIFGTMIAAGIFLAWDVNEWVLGVVKAPAGTSSPTPAWIVFLTPAIALGTIGLLELVLLRDHPSLAGHDDIETGALVYEGESAMTTLQVARRILTHPVVLTIALIEFCTGVLRQGVLQWGKVYSNEQAAAAGATSAWSYFASHEGALVAVAGILGANAAGWVSDVAFGSRRAPAACLLYGIVTASVVALVFSLGNAWAVCAMIFMAQLAVLGTHGLLSGTATMDFGGRRGTATAVGIIDGFVYLGTALQSFAIPRLIEKGAHWERWPIFLVPFGAIGIALLLRIWNAMPQGKRPAHP